MHSKEAIIVISPIGELDVNGTLLDSLRAEIQRVYGYHTEVLPLLNEVDLRMDPVRKQYHSTPIIETLALLIPPRAVKVLGITKVDLFIPILTHVYGEAQLGGKACILSTHRFIDAFSLGSGAMAYCSRVAKEAIHELGHTFNLRHCRDPRCTMHYCRSVQEVDRKSNHFCRYCAILLEDEMNRLGKSV